MKLGRNDLCWCGSGKKYKKCHMLLPLQNSTKAARTNGKVVRKWIKNPDAIEKMRNAGKFNAQLMEYIKPFVKPGIATAKLDKMIHEYTLEHKHIPACLNYRGYPRSSCISVNEIVCHGIPDDSVILKEGNIVNIDITTIVDGYHGDQSETILLEPVSKTAKKLTIVAANAMIEGISCVKPGVSFARIGEVIENYAHSYHFSVVVDFTGHGIGKSFHEDPPIYHFKNTESLSFLMDAGMTFTIEPMVNEGTFQVDVDKKDKWTVRTRDRKLSAQFEHTILVTETGFEILTLTPSQIQAKKICHFATHPNNSI